MSVKCRVCAKDILSPSDAMSFRFRSRHLFYAHTGQCTEVVHSGMKYLKKTASTALKGYIERKAPGFFKTLQLLAESRLVDDV